MKPIRRIVVGVSLGADVTPKLEVTDLDRNTFDNALWLAQKTGAELHLHHAVDWVGFDPLSSAPDLATAAREQAEGVLDGLLGEAAEAGVTASRSVSTGPASRAMLDVVEKREADLIVVGPRAHSGGLLGRLSYGSSAKALAREATCHVWVVQPGTDKGFTRAVFLVDLSPVSKAIVEFGDWIRETVGVETEILHCVDFPADIALSRLPNAHDEIRKYHQTVLQAAERGIDELIGEERKGWYVSVIDDWVVRVAPKIADARAADLLVMASTSRTGLAKVLGTTATRLIDRATQSILIFRPEL